MVHVLLKGIGQLVALQRGAVGVVPDLDRAVGRKKLRPGVGLEAQHGFLQQRMPDLGHAFDRCAVARPLNAGQFDLEAQQLDALRPVVDPLSPAVQIVLHTAQQVFGDAAQFVLLDVVGKVVEPALWSLLAFGVFDGLAVEGHGDGPIAMVDPQDGTIGIELRDISLLVRVLDRDVHGGDSSLFRLFLQSDVW